MTIFVRFEGMAEAAATLRALPEQLEGKGLLRLSQVAFDEAQRGAGRHNKTGALVQSLFNREMPGGREVGHDPQRAPHALFVHFGTKPHVIRPKNAKALRFSAGGKFVFARSVNHPGYRGDPYVHNAADVALRQFDAIINRIFDEAKR